jgi:hypothetical protein
MNKNYLLAILFAFSGIFAGSCDKDTSCPPGNLCVSGNILEFQTNNNTAKIIIEVPEGAVYNNAAVIISDLIPGYPSGIDYDTPEFRFGGGLFKIEPIDLPIKDIIKITIKYPQDATSDYLGNNYASDYRLYFVKDGSWSIVNNSQSDPQNGLVWGNVLRLGTYAVGAVKECLQGDWRKLNSDTIYGYSSRIVFLNTGKGWRETIVDCDTSSNISLQIGREDFSYTLFQDSILNVFQFSPFFACSATGITNPDVMGIIARCSDDKVVFEGFGQFSGQFSRYD